MLLALLLLHASASALHFAHNGMFVADYPNLPSWITASGVYVSWVCISAIGVAGYTMTRRGLRQSGLAAICVYAILGFGGLDHYLLAPIGAHTLAMNFTIGFEVATAAVLLIMAARQLFEEVRAGRIPGAHKHREVN